jgi:secreted Zn-dependent insulinase-like peptidase
MYVHPAPQEGQHIVTVTWQWPPNDMGSMSGAADFLGHLLTYAGSGGLLSQLKHLGWGHFVRAGTDPEDGALSSSCFQLFQVCSVPCLCLQRYRHELRECS